MGEGLARALGGAQAAARARGVGPAGRAHEHDVPVTVHAAIGAEIIHQHPAADGAAIGATSHRDFRRLAGSLPALRPGRRGAQPGQRGRAARGLPQGAHHRAQPRRRAGPTHFLAADFDMQRHYRPRVNVVQRPTRAGGAGYLLTGHHELLLPRWCWGMLGRKAEPDMRPSVGREA